MTIDEKLEKLTGRHGALMQTVELPAADNQKMAVENKQRERGLAMIIEGCVSVVHMLEIPRATNRAF